MTSSPVAASDERTWKRSVDLPMPGGPNSSVTEPATTPPPMTRSSSLTPVGSGWMASVDTSASGSAGGPSAGPALEPPCRTGAGRERVPLTAGGAAARPTQRGRGARGTEIGTLGPGARSGCRGHGGRVRRGVCQQRRVAGGGGGGGGRLRAWTRQGFGSPWAGGARDGGGPPATTADRAGILAVVGDAFSYGGTRDPGGELAVVQGTWSAQPGRPLLELVVAEGGALVGHLQAAPGRLDGRATAVAGVAPVCVASAHQSRGIGSALMAALIGEAEELHWPLLVLLGDPAYYGRFGFEAAAPLGLSYPPAGPGNPHFQARRLPAPARRCGGSSPTAGSEAKGRDGRIPGMSAQIRRGLAKL